MTKKTEIGRTSYVNSEHLADYMLFELCVYQNHCDINNAVEITLLTASDLEALKMKYRKQGFETANSLWMSQGDAKFEGVDWEEQEAK